MDTVDGNRIKIMTTREEVTGSKRDTRYYDKIVESLKSGKSGIGISTVAGLLNGSSRTVVDCGDGRYIRYIRETRYIDMCNMEVISEEDLPNFRFKVDTFIYYNSPLKTSTISDDGLTRVTKIPWKYRRCGSKGLGEGWVHFHEKQILVCTELYAIEFNINYVDLVKPCCAYCPGTGKIKSRDVVCTSCDYETEERKATPEQYKIYRETLGKDNVVQLPDMDVIWCATEGDLIPEKNDVGKVRYQNEWYSRNQNGY